MTTFFIKRRCVSYEEVEVEADDEDAAWDAYHDQDRTFPVMLVDEEWCEDQGEIRVATDTPTDQPRSTAPEEATNA